MKRILASLLVIGAIGSATLAFSNAFFSDTEKSSGNNFTAGRLDLLINGQNNPSAIVNVSDLKPNKFVVPPGWYGFVNASGPGIVHSAIVDQKIGMIALERLASPDRESRTEDFQGRRMVRIDGGYVILNFMKYRDKDNTSAERSRRYRERQRLLEHSKKNKK